MTEDDSTAVWQELYKMFGDTQEQLDKLAASAESLGFQSAAGQAQTLGNEVENTGRKAQETAGIFGQLGQANSSTTTFEDKDIMIGAKYEYKIEGKGANFSSFGYIGSGIEIDRTLQVGKDILVIEKNVVDSLQPEIIRWTHDVQNERWEVASLIVARDANVKSIRDSIKGIYSSTMIRPVSVFLLGHVPVPYSGNLAPDGHPDHQGAWPTDGYYGEVDHYFTDNQVNNTVASDGRNDNVPGDGKFDQSNFFGPLEMQVGRVDMYNLPAFGFNEIQLLRNYLTKDHVFRTGQFKPRHKAIIDDNFGYFSGEAFASSGWSNFSSLVGVDSTESGDYFTPIFLGDIRQLLFGSSGA